MRELHLYVADDGALNLRMRKSAYGMRPDVERLNLKGE